MGLYDDIVREPVRSLHLRQVVGVSPETPVREVVERLCQAKLGCAMVLDSEGKPLGVFTEAVLIRLLARDPALLSERVGNHLAAHWATVEISEPIARVLEAMTSEHLRFVCVTDREGKAAALTGQRGLVEFIAAHFPQHVQSMARRIGSESISQEREGP